MSKPDHPTIEQLTDYVHGELSEHDDVAVHAHLADCAACTELHDTEAGLSELLRAHARAEERDLPPGFAARIVDAAIASERQPVMDLREIFARMLRPAIAVPVVAAAALAIYFGTNAQHPTRGTATIDAAAFMDSHAALATDMPFADSSALPVAFTSDVDGTGANGP